MTTVDEIVRIVLELIKSQAGLSGATYTTAFAPEKLPNPLKKNRVSVGLEAVKMSAGAIGQYLSGDTCGSRSDVILKIRVYCPEEKGGDTLNEICSRICTVLMTSGRAVGIHSVSCGEIKYETTAMAYTIDCRTELVTYVGEYDEDRPLTGIVIKGKGE